jgi:tetrahydromethanopterin S-methyltransferase subunit H
MLQNSFYTIGTIKIGYGDFVLPPVMIGTLFYQGQTLIDRKNPTNFNREKAKKRINTQINLSKQYKLPHLIEISANEPDSISEYLRFYLENYEPPFVLGGTFEARMEGLRYLNDYGLNPDEFIYNSISNLKNPKEVDAIKAFKIQNAVVLILGANNMTSTQRFTYLTEKNQPNGDSIITGLKKLGVKKILIDGGVIDLESLVHILETQKIISESLRLPVGTAPSLFLFKFSSPRLNIKYHTRYRRASIMAFASLFSNFIFYGAIEDAKECFASIYQARAFRNTLQDLKIKLFQSL